MPRMNDPRTPPTEVRRPAIAVGVRLLIGAAVVLVLAACATQTAPNADLSLTDVEPATGNETDVVTVRGDNIAGNAEVQLCGESATNVVVRDPDGAAIGGDAKDGVTVAFNPPALGADATCDVEVEQGSGSDAESATLAGSFAYQAPQAPELALDGVSPASASNGDVVTLTGENIAGDATVTVCGEGGTNVEVLDDGGDPVTGDAKDGVELLFTVPAVGTDGSCDIVVSQGSGGDAEAATLAGEFTYDTSGAAGASILINAGGPEVTTATGTWMADDHFVGGGTFDTDEADILGTDEDEIYVTERDGTSAHDPFSYEIPVPVAVNDEYTLRLHFAELFIGTDEPGADGTGVGSRLFDFAAEGTQLETDYDVYAEGGGQPYVAVEEAYTVTVTDGELNLEFTPTGANGPFVSAIEIEYVEP